MLSSLDLIGGLFHLAAFQALVTVPPLCSFRSKGVNMLIFVLQCGWTRPSLYPLSWHCQLMKLPPTLKWHNLNNKLYDY